jgi:hypothetical protein
MVSRQLELVPASQRQEKMDLAKEPTSRRA